MVGEGSARLKTSVELEGIEAIVEPIVGEAGFELVAVEKVTIQGRAHLRISIDREDNPGTVSIDDCVRVNRLLSELPALDQVYAGPYNLEVSSPGVNRPLTRERDFLRFAGEKAQIVVSEPIDGRRRFTGRLQGLREGTIVLNRGKEGSVSIPLQSVVKASLKPDTADLFKIAERAREAKKAEATKGAEGPAEVSEGVHSR